MLPRQNSSRPYTSGSFRTKLELFEKFIAEFTYVDDELNPEERRQILQSRLTNGYEPFCEAIRDLFGNDVSTQDLKALFRKIALNPDADVDWSELFGIGSSTDEVSDLLLNEDTSSVFTTSKRRTVAEAGGDKKRRDVVQSIVYVPKYDFYITASQKGVICHFSSKFRLKACTDIHESSWVTGCGFLPSLRRIVVTSERALALWDYRAKQKQSTVYRIKPLENPPQCMTYIPWKTNSMNEDTIIFGDDQGYVNMLTISSKDFHMKNSTSKNDGQVVNIEPAKLSNEIRRRKFHDDWVLKLRYFPQLEMFGSCSPSSTCSFVLGTLDRILDNSPVRELAVPKGVNCFDYCSRANVIITAGADKVIRIWHPLIFTRPTGKLLGHLFTLVELAVNEKDQQLVSLSTARVFRVWDIQTLTCLQVFTDNEVRPGEKRISSMLFDPKHDRLITGCSVIDTWPLTRAIQDSLQVPHSHDRPICQLFYNPQMNQVITGCTEGSMKVWEMETGQLVYQVQEAHGPSNEITAITTDSMGYRLVTGAYDGSIKVWDFGSGQLYKRFPDEKAKHDDTITGLVYHVINDIRFIFVSAWGRKIRILEDSYDEPVLLEIRTLNDLFMPTTPRRAANQDFSTFVSRAPLPSIGETEEGAWAGEVHALSTCEVTCLDFHEPGLLIAGTTDGTLLVWDVQTGKIVMRCDAPQGTSARSASRRRRSQQDQQLVHSCRLVTHRLRRPVIYGKSNVSFRVPSEQSDAASATPAEQAARTEEEDGTEKTEEGGSKSGELDPLEQETTAENEDKLGQEKPPDSPREGEGRAATGSVDRDESPARVDLLEQHDFGRDVLRISEPVIAACYHDGYLRFWGLSGKLLNEIRALTRRHASAVTAMCADADCKYLVSGDAKGYITVWDVGNFLLDPPTKNEARQGSSAEGRKHTKNDIKQVIAWRGHVGRVVGLEHVVSADIIVSASTDCSARVWYRDTGHFIGYFGQPRLWHLPSSKSVPSTPIRPYDISEVPLKTLRHLATKKHKAENSVDCPLMFDDERWSPFRHSAKQNFRSPAIGNKKFFDSLSKPKHYNTHLESSRTGFPETGAVFRALPVYRVETPERLKTPACHPTHQLPKGFSNKANMSYRPSSPTREAVVSRFPHLVIGRKR